MESIKSFTVTNLPRVIFGEGKFSELHNIIQSYGHRALVITGAESLKKSGKYDDLTLRLKQSNIEYNSISVQGEPTTELVDAVTGDCRRIPINVVAAIGGGSVIDCGKAVAAMLTENGSVKDYLEGVGSRKPSGKKVPFIAVPTTAGTGSEATKNAVICNRKEGFKKSLRHDAYMPDVAIIDPELTRNLPRYITISCGLDAVSQLIESYTSLKTNVFIDSLVSKAISLASESLLPLSFDKGEDMSLRGKMSYAALISGISLSHAGLGTVHGLAGPLGGLFPAPHGIVCGKLLFPIMTFTIKKIIDENNLPAQKRFADIGRLMTGDASHDNVACCRQFLNVLNKWTQAVKLPQLSCFGMNSAHIEKAISLADNKNSPVKLSREEM
ncbi:MAG: iron-containing alcohol dehydrogenase, partial [Smithella sp.]